MMLKMYGVNIKVNVGSLSQSAPLEGGFGTFLYTKIHHDVIAEGFYGGKKACLLFFISGKGLQVIHVKEIVTLPFCDS